MSIGSNSVFIKDALNKEEKKKFALFFNLPEKAFDRALGVFDIIDFKDTSTTSEFKHRLILFHYAIHLVDKLHTLGLEFTPEVIHKILSIRGIVVAEKENTLRIIDKSNGYTKVQVMDKLPNAPLFTNNGEEVDVVYKKWIHGSLIRCFKYNGVVYASTHRKISCSKSVFANSESTFEDMLLNDQNTFPTIDSFFSGVMNKDSYVHLFILNNRSLMVESGVKLTEDSVYYVGTIDLSLDPVCDFSSIVVESYIKEKNETVDKPIKIAQTLTFNEVNEVLRGETSSSLQMPVGSLRDVNDFLRTLPSELCLNLYKNQGSVIAHVYGPRGTDVFRIMPTSKRNSNLVMNGVPNPGKIFTDLLSKYGNGTLLDEIPLLPVGFNIEQLTDIAKKLEKFEPVDIDSYDIFKVTVPELILTTVIFSSPNSLVMEAIKTFNSFGENVIETMEFLFENRGRMGSDTGLEQAIKSKNPKKFDGFLNLNKSAQNYMNKQYLGCFFEKSKSEDGYNIDKIVGDGIQSHWHHVVTERFRDNDLIGTLEYKQRNALLAFISNAPPEALYSLLQFKGKVLRTREAFTKTTEI